MLSSEITNLCCLLIDDVSSVVEVFINQILVGDVDQGNEVYDGGCNEGDSPSWDELDKEVGYESGREGLYKISTG